MGEIRYFIWAALAGAFIPVMAVLNGKLGRSLGDPLYAVMTLFGLGFALFSIGSLLFGKVPLELSSFKSVEPVQFVGGLIVGFYVISATVLAPRIGVANFIMMAVAAQMIFSVVIDHWGLFGVAVRPLNMVRFLGVVVLITGVAIIQMAENKPVGP